MQSQNMTVFLDKLLCIMRELEHLGSQFSEAYAYYDGIDFPEQSMLASDKLDNLILAATHETASEIGFLAQDIKTLVHFIEFRQSYKSFLEDELKEIIDNPSISLSLKQDIASKKMGGDIKATLNIIQEIQRVWNSTFHNQSFQSIRRLYALKKE